jgi:hypothetical protein
MFADVLLDPLRQVRDAPQRCLQVVGSDIRELVELGIAALEGRCRASQLLGALLHFPARVDLVRDVDRE